MSITLLQNRLFQRLDLCMSSRVLTANLEFFPLLYTIFFLYTVVHFCRRRRHGRCLFLLFILQVYAGTYDFSIAFFVTFIFITNCRRFTLRHI